MASTNRHEMDEKINIQIGDRQAEGPIYAQIRQQFETLIQSKQLESGASLPSPAALEQRLNAEDARECKMQN